jgi:hypothetical protein
MRMAVLIVIDEPPQREPVQNSMYNCVFFVPRCLGANGFEEQMRKKGEMNQKILRGHWNTLSTTV